MKAKKSLGQHFLRSERALRSIVDASDPCTKDVILEIGPGEGVLTERLLLSAGKVVAVEKDDVLYKGLGDKFSNEVKGDKLVLIHQDILEFDPASIALYRDLKYKIAANIPYNITGQVFRKFLSAEYQPQSMVLLVQKEVAERVVAKGGKESILSISVKAYGTPHYIDTVRAGSFAPAPQVDSAILLVDDISKKFFTPFSEEAFFGMVRAGFSSKRKKLSSNLATLYPKEKVLEVFHSLNIDSNIRAEDVPLDTWRDLARILI